MLADTQRRAGVYIDESWFVLWPQQASRWARRKRPLRIPKNKSWDRKHRPPSCALYARMDAVEREVVGEWHPTWNQHETWQHLQGVIKDYQRRGMRYLVVFWDHGPWHRAFGLRQRVVEHNRQAKAGEGVRLLLFYLPKKSPWLMPLEPVFGQTKRAVGSKQRRDMADLQSAVERRLERRNARIHKYNHHSNARKLN